MTVLGATSPVVWDFAVLGSLVGSIGSLPRIFPLLLICPPGPARRCLPFLRRQRVLVLRSAALQRSATLLQRSATLVQRSATLAGRLYMAHGPALRPMQCSGIELRSTCG